MAGVVDEELLAYATHRKLVLEAVASLGVDQPVSGTRAVH